MLDVVLCHVGDFFSFLILYQFLIVYLQNMTSRFKYFRLLKVPVEVNHKKVSAIIATTFLATSILIMYPFLQASASSPTFPNDGVRLLATHTQPIVLHVGNLFHIHTIVFNNSPGTISFIAGPCDSPLAGNIYHPCSFLFNMLGA